MNETISICRGPIIHLPGSWEGCIRTVTQGTPVGFPFTDFTPPDLRLLPRHTIYRGTEKYLTRYWLLGGHDPKTNSTKHPDLPFNLFLHCFHASDDPPAHDHPWPWARSLILQGSYIEIRERLGGTPLENEAGQLFRPGDVNVINADTRHYVTLQTPEVWTLFLVGEKDRPWGFWTPGGWVRACEYVGPDVVDGER